MNTSKDTNKLPAARLHRAIEGFRGFCEEDLEWRRNSGEEFDETSFNQARNLVMEKLEGLRDDTADRPQQAAQEESQ